MTKKHFIHAAKQVKGILDGFTGRQYLPTSSANHHRPIECSTETAGNLNAHYVRACWLAESYLELFSAYTDRFDRQRFLIACGLAELPPKPYRSRS